LVSLNLPPLIAPPYNSHYEGEYTDRMLRWRSLCALDKAANLEAALTQAGAGTVSRVLEVGCGTGAVLYEVKRRGIGTAHFGIDLADPNAHLHPGVAGAGLSLSAYDGASIPFGDASFDLVYASHVLEHVPDERGFLAELARVASRWIYVEVPCEVHLRTRMRDIQNTLNIGHINAYTPETLALTLTTSGLAPSDVHVFDHSMAVHAFDTGGLKARAKAALRRGLLSASPGLASRLFTYHAGALIDVTRLAR
jgi:SAM-dependent methyltransferase